METFEIYMGLLSAAGLLTMLLSLRSLIAERKRARCESRERRRKNLSRNTVNTILRYSAKQEEAAYYGRRA